MPWRRNDSSFFRMKIKCFQVGGVKPEAVWMSLGSKTPMWGVMDGTYKPYVFPVPYDTDITAHLPPNTEVYMRVPEAEVEESKFTPEYSYWDDHKTFLRRTSIPNTFLFTSLGFKVTKEGLVTDANGKLVPGTIRIPNHELLGLHEAFKFNLKVCKGLIMRTSHSDSDLQGGTEDRSGI